MNRELLGLVNRARRSAGAGNLTMTGALNRAAQRHARDCRANGHTGSDGSSMGDRIRASGYSPMRAAGENVYRESRPGSVQNASNAWMNSPGHRRNILNSRFREMGFSRHDCNNRHRLRYMVQA